MPRAYPATPAGRSRRLRDTDDAHMTARGHRMKWGRWRKGDFFDGGNCLNAPGWEGRCERCGDTLRVAWLRDGATYTSYTDAGGKDRSFRKCKGGRRR